MSEPTFPALPVDLAARLAAAGATDEASRRRAFDADPDLRRDYEAFLAANQEQIVGALMGQLLAAFRAVPDGKALVEFWGQIPLALEDPFIAFVEEQIVQAEQASNAGLAEGLRERLDGLRQFQSQQQAMASLAGRFLAALESTGDDEVAAVWREIPLELEDAFLAAAGEQVEAAEQAGDGERAARLRARVAALREVQTYQRAVRDARPTERALLAFLRAESDDAARQVFDNQRDLLQPYEAQRMLDAFVQNAPAEAREQLARRSLLLRQLRGAAVAPSQSESPASRSDKSVQPQDDRRPDGGHVYINSAHVEGSGTAIVVNNILIERQWTRPQPPPLPRRMVEREEDMRKAMALLEARGHLVISGQATLTVQGMPGIGKTTLANQLALALDARYPDGVIWEPIGPDFTSSEQAQPILNRWARYALVMPQNLDAALQFDSGAVRALFGARPQLLVVLDNVWSLDAIRPLRDALPRDAALVITTRLQAVGIGLGDEPYVLDVLSAADARKLIALRLGWPEVAPEHEPWCAALAAGVGHHTLALDVALGLLRLEGETPEEWQQSVQRIVDYIAAGQGFADLRIEEGDREQNVELVLSYSYDRMDAAARRRFRLLGAFAPDLDFATPAVAQLWACEAEQSRGSLNKLVNAALLNRAGVGRWRQHGLLRGYALALLRREGEYEAAASHHAEIYGDAMREADDAGRFYLMLPEYPQLRHAFAWASENDLGRAQDLIAGSAGLQGAFGLARDNLSWCEAALAVARRRGSPADVARAHGSLGNALQGIAALPSEDRRVRLLEALAAYDEALRFRTPETAPLDYAMTQNNRANLLSEIAALAGEDRRERLLEALAAYDEVLRFYTPETAPLDYAMTQNNRANQLSQIATLAGEDRRERLLEALAAYDEALHFYTPETALLDYAATQNNRALLLGAIATLVGEDRRERLLAALAAYDEALRFRTPETVPLAYATTQNNRAVVLSEIATLAGEDRRVRLLAALAAYNEALRFRTPETTPLDYATTQNNRAILLSQIATLAGEDRRERLLAALAACDEALRFRTPETAPLDYAMTQNNRAALLSKIATLAGEDRRVRLLAALAAYNEALRFYTPEAAPLDYATTQNNRAALLSEIATLAGEDRRVRLLVALAAYDEALRFRTPETTPLDYAATQSNRANLLSQIATLAGEDRRERLLAALAACDEALRFRTPETVPLAYATTQNNRAAVLSEIATLAGEDRRARLLAALAAYNEALRFRTPETAPLDYAMTQNNRALLLSEIATLAGEDRRARLLAAIAAAREAVSLFQHLQHEHYFQIGQGTLNSIHAVCGEDFAALWAELGAGPPPEWLDQPAPGLPADLKARLDAAGVTDEASLQRALDADPELKRDVEAVFAASQAQAHQAQIQQFLSAFLAVPDRNALVEFWRRVPLELEDTFIAAVEAWIAQAEQEGANELAEALRQRLDGVRQLRAAQQQTAVSPLGQEFRQALDRYLELRRAAEQSERDAGAWQAAVEAGEALLAPEFAEIAGVNWPALHENLANAYTYLGTAQEAAGDLLSSLAATEQAIALQPDRAMWRRNRAGTLIDLGRLDDAAQEIAAARALEPEAPRLAELDAALAQAQAATPGGTKEGDNAGG